ncbi:winged helix-turn-helix domain-containing protein [Rahnella victoriana]|uniref:winged helix-turn-helix domain-containing protein n=1 Tax=Rahnella victoriana TaxID=1510570 RepID=UPI001E5D9F82|nr:helix-turn-helix domain-containing protein [Rahnella victoriana]UHM93653.1 helix-turn-helix domain-containing protein [Rahnella victoriana]
MKYLIDKTISFNTDDGVLTQVDTDNAEIVNLSIPAARLLDEFARSGGRELTREYLMENVWEIHGLQATDGNLRQYISILRRNLALLGCPEFIVTIPKVGFKANPDIPVVMLNPEQSVAKTSTFEGGATLSPPRANKGFVWWCSILFMLFLFVGLSAFLLHNRLATVVLPGHYVSDNGCDITYVKDIPDATRKDNVALITDILKRNDLQCSKDNMVIFDKEISPASDNNSRIMLSFCYTGKDKEVISCENFYEYKKVEK